MENDQRANLSVGKENALLVCVDLRDPDYDAGDSLRELWSLAESAGAVVVASMRQRRDRIDPRYYIGRGKVADERPLPRRRRTVTNR